ncbi:hypothetical protein OKS_03799 [Enterococcus faecium EnGen0047]|uniref:DUF1048 domain-containing protein n=1 Tax=Enterococcus TaxID=1350 RepID=UPI0002A3AA48|nr:DUF1048 domain-containing protein [Enterococcus faecium]EGP4756893.1 DUF1048 domain-containing protein [Enterococcus faecium]EGP5084019.1 DUF1048 domain-containing protein [Enterococcus faecium]EGP5096481.1 DUF1048 domain-containing protein [Enterococcus faecium]EGP5286278.1 DUF1048 domain-containing protein [Enterococcus faecium]EGP5668240.1 DUF1048 domain-containing protein [Enterococcus faecium]
MSNKNLVGYIKKMMEDKAEYREQMARLKKLPADYQIVYNEIQKFLWEFTAGDGMDMLSAMYELLDFFEEGASNGFPVLELVGEDVGQFAENTLHEIQAKTRINELKRKMNERIAKKMEKL